MTGNKNCFNGGKLSFATYSLLAIAIPRLMLPLALRVSNMYFNAYDYFHWAKLVSNQTEITHIFSRRPFEQGEIILLVRSQTRSILTFGRNLPKTHRKFFFVFFFFKNFLAWVVFEKTGISIPGLNLSFPVSYCDGIDFRS